MSTASPGGVQSVHRSLDLLETIASRGGHLSLGELSEASRIPMATTHRLLRTLLQRGYVRQRGDRRYALGLRMVPLGAAANALASETVHAVLADLVRDLGETSNLAVLAGRRAEYVAQAPSRHSMRMFTEVGQRVDLHSTGVGKAMLAHLGEGDAAAVLGEGTLASHTAHTLVRHEDLHAALSAIRRDGYALDDEEQELGVRCVAVPVPGPGPAMAVSVSGPVSRVTDEVVQRAVPALQVAARRLVAGPTAS